MAERAKKTLEESLKEKPTMTAQASEISRSPPSRTPSMRLNQAPSPTVSHRHSFSDQLRGIPLSPRSSRQFSHSSAAGVQELLDNPPKTGAEDPAFAGRDWHDIAVGELVDSKDVRFVEEDTSIEKATNLLVESGASALLIRAAATEASVVGTFDYKDLNQYLLFATQSLRPDPENLSVFHDLAKKAQLRQEIPLKEAKKLGTKEPPVTLSHTDHLTKAVELFGGGTHRIIVVKDGTKEVVGILGQLQLVKFLWENSRSFPGINKISKWTIKDLAIGSHGVISVNGFSPLKEALVLMDNESVSSLAVVDNQFNVIGNISTVDVKLLTRESSALPLLENTCGHFISVILSSRGIRDGQDSVPVFHISPSSTLAHAIAKLVATKSHRMWVVDSPSPSSSGPSTPALQPAVPYLSHQLSTTNLTTPPFTPTPSSPGISSFSGAYVSGRLSAVVSLTDILNLFARASGLHPQDPGEKRLLQRRSSGSSAIGGCMDSARSSSLDISKR